MKTFEDFMLTAQQAQDEGEKRFYMVLALINETWRAAAQNTRDLGYNILAFHYGVWLGESGEARALRGSDDPGRILNFELGVRLGPEIQAAGSKLTRALISAGVSLLLGEIGKINP